MNTALFPHPQLGINSGAVFVDQSLQMHDFLLGLNSEFNELMNITRLPEHQEKYPELKDPCVIATPDGKFTLFASIGNSITQQWIVGRFSAQSIEGPWTEVAPVIFKNISGPQLCAPAVTYEEVEGQPLWKMYIQTACFEEDGVIALAKSTDGLTFVGEIQPLAARHSVEPEHQPNVIGVYDVGVSEVKNNEDDLVCMLFSGYRRVGCGDLYMSYKKKTAGEYEWSTAQRLLAQEDVPFHNHPSYEHFEWGLEGAKLIQLATDCYLLIGVCFQPRPVGFEGTRQRVFFAVSSSLNGPFVPVGMPFTPYAQEGKNGENGHPDTLVIGNEFWVIYQERDGDGKPWYFRTAKYNIAQLATYFQDILATHSNERNNFRC
jgi:hypothetical protein